jgi:hypothetical protein
MRRVITSFQTVGTPCFQTGSHISSSCCCIVSEPNSKGVQLWTPPVITKNASSCNDTCSYAVLVCFVTSPISWLPAAAAAAAAAATPVKQHKHSTNHLYWIFLDSEQLNAAFDCYLLGTGLRPFHRPLNVALGQGYPTHIPRVACDPQIHSAQPSLWSYCNYGMWPGTFSKFLPSV